MNTEIAHQKLTAIYEINRLLGEALKLESTLQNILEILGNRLSMKRATVWLEDEKEGVLVIKASHGLTAEEQKRGIYRVGEGVTGRIFQAAEPCIVEDISAEPLFLNKTGARNVEKGGISFLGVPILLRGMPIGVLNVDRLFSDEVSLEEDIEFLSIVAGLISQIVSLNREVNTREEGLLRANRSLKAELTEKYNNFFMVGGSKSIRNVQHLVSKVASSRASVLLLGESGTGKTLIAKILHEMSPRKDRPFVMLNCGALPDNLLESELFGYEKGAFTGADTSKSGRIEEAHEGTLFLDEVGELPLLLQTKLLRFIQEREFERLGSTKTRRVDVRIVAATNKDLTEAVSDGTFREDLFYRLNVFPIQVPPLRDRAEDLPQLIGHFVRKFSKEYNQPMLLSPAAKKALSDYHWPGNVRELENLIERLAIISGGEAIGREDLPPHIFGANSRVKAGGKGSEEVCHLEDVEKREVIHALERNKWIQSRAAKELGITVRQLGYRIKKFHLEEEVFLGRNKSH
ncbi:MAG: sigma-54-dependent Fis family transcriptional regulator [Deltaproteobacteria bacterium]|nr:MAG: sigma-54-dependent Fis family transcriptional regulator [Deltaproteobacteria bacterium]